MIRLQYRKKSSLRQDGCRERMFPYFLFISVSDMNLYKNSETVKYKKSGKPDFFMAVCMDKTADFL